MAEFSITQFTSSIRRLIEEKNIDRDSDGLICSNNGEMTSLWREMKAKTIFNNGQPIFTSGKVFDSEGNYHIMRDYDLDNLPDEIQVLDKNGVIKETLSFCFDEGNDVIISDNQKGIDKNGFPSLRSIRRYENGEFTLKYNINYADDDGDGIYDTYSTGRDKFGNRISGDVGGGLIY